MNFKSVFITGGAGYAGSSLVPDLLKKNFRVTVYDIMYFGDNFLPKNHPNLKIIKGDIRDKNKLEKSCEGYDVFLHLACISNDASFQLDENLSKGFTLLPIGLCLSSIASLILETSNTVSHIKSIN